MAAEASVLPPEGGGHSGVKGILKPCLKKENRCFCLDLGEFIWRSKLSFQQTCVDMEVTEDI